MTVSPLFATKNEMAKLLRVDISYLDDVLSTEEPCGSIKFPKQKPEPLYNYPKIYAKVYRLRQKESQ